MRRGCVVLARNVRVGRNEIDLIVRHEGVLVAVEVKTRRFGDPLARFDADKVAGLRSAIRRLDPRPQRLDLVTVELGGESATVRWVKGAG